MSDKEKKNLAQTFNSQKPMMSSNVSKRSLMSFILGKNSAFMGLNIFFLINNF